MRIFLTALLLMVFLLSFAGGCNPFAKADVNLTITGKVVDKDGKAVNGALVRTNPATTLQKTNEDGAYTITDVSSGTYKLLVSKAGYKTVEYDIEAKTSVFVCDAGKIRKDVVLEEQSGSEKTGEIYGAVKDKDGKVVGDVKIMTDPATSEVKTDTNGVFVVTDVKAGTYTVKGTKDGYKETVQEAVVVEGGKRTEIELAIYANAQLGKITGKITNTAGTNLEGVTITTTPATQTKTTDSNGDYEIADVSPGDYTITAIKSGYDTGTKTVSLSEGQTADGNITLNYSSGVIITIAGTGTAGYSGDGGQATLAQVNGTSGIALDGSGNIFLGDRNNHRVRKINISGIITTIAGTGTAGYSGDGGQATSAQLNYVYGVAVDVSGNVYIADYNNAVVRKVNTSGVMSTIAGTGTAGYTGDSGLATAAQLNRPTGVTIDIAGNIYIADYYNAVIRKINTSGVITTIAGNGSTGYGGDGGQATSAQFNQLRDVAVDVSGNIYVADQWNHRVRKINTSGIISTIAGTGTAGYGGDGGQAISAQLNAPNGVAVDGSGNIFIADTNNHRIRKVNTSGVISTIAGTGTAGYSGDGGQGNSAQINTPYAVAVDSVGNIYFADRGNARIRKVIK